MSMIKSEKLKAILEAKNIILHANAPEQAKKKSLLECGITDDSKVSFLLKMKHGVLTTMTMSLDGVDEDSDNIVKFRLLSVTEELEIIEEMRKEHSKLTPIDFDYKYYKALKTISKASKSIPSKIEFNQPEFNEKELKEFLTVGQLAYLEQKYLEFKQAFSPQLDTLTVDEISQVVEDLIQESEGNTDNVKKPLDMLSGLSYHQIQQICTDLVRKLTTFQKQMEALCIGI